MPFRYTDPDGRTYVFDDRQKVAVKKLIRDNIALQRKVCELESKLGIMEVLLEHSNRREMKTIDATIAYLDPQTG